MEKILPSLIEQWPALAGLISISAIFWTLFKKYLEENKNLLEGVRAVSSEHNNSIQKVLERYRDLSEDQVKEIDRLRVLVTSLVNENEKIGKRYDDIKSEFTKVALENNALLRVIENIEEMVRATGGDVKVISKQLEKSRNEIKGVSDKIFLLEQSNNKSNV